METVLGPVPTATVPPISSATNPPLAATNLDFTMPNTISKNGTARMKKLDYDITNKWLEGGR